MYLFLSTSFGIETMNTFVHSYEFPREPYQIPDPNGQSLYPFSDQNGAGTLPFGAAHTYMAYIWEYPPTPRDFHSSLKKSKREVYTYRRLACPY